MRTELTSYIARSLRHRLLAAALTGAAALAVACSPGDAGAGGDQASAGADSLIAPDPLVLGFIPSQQADSIVPDAERIGEFLSQRMGRRIEVRVPSTYEPLIEGLRFGHVHATFLDGGAGWIAHKRVGAEVILAEVQNGSTHYFAEAFTSANSGIDSLAEVRGKRLAFTSRTGSSGFLMPVGSMIQAGIIEPQGNELTDLEGALQRSFAATIDAGGYKQALVAVLDGRADVAFGAHDAPQRFLTEAERGRIVSFHRFGRIPSHAVLVSNRLAPEVVQQLTDAMMALNEPANLPLLQAVYGVEGLTPATTTDHLGDFGRALEALPGMERTLLSKSN